MSCNCNKSNPFWMFDPWNFRPDRKEKEEKQIQERPKVKVIKKKKDPVEEPQEENTENEPLV